MRKRSFMPEKNLTFYFVRNRLKLRAQLSLAAAFVAGAGTDVGSLLKPFKRTY